MTSLCCSRYCSNWAQDTERRCLSKALLDIVSQKFLPWYYFLMFPSHKGDFPQYKFQPWPCIALAGTLYSILLKSYPCGRKSLGCPYSAILYLELHPEPFLRCLFPSRTSCIISWILPWITDSTLPCPGFYRPCCRYNAGVCYKVCLSWLQWKQ